MILKVVIDKFRLAEDLEIEIGKNLTAICGQNGTMKSTLLGCIAQPFGVGRGRKKDDKKEKYSDCMIVNQKFYTDINDIFKFSKEYDLPGNHVYHVYFDKDSNIMKQEEKIVYENPLQVKSRKRPVGEKKHIRFVTGKERSTGKGNIPIPVVYLGLSRLYPIGEVDNLKENSLELSNEEIKFLKENYSEILLSFDSEEYKDEIKLIDKNKISTGGISTNSYDWQTISAGQDNIGKIILTVLEFKRLKEKFKENYFGGILLIDELEATLYPGAQKKLIEFLNRYSARYDIKVIFTTHSLEIIEELLNSKTYNNSKVNFLDKTKGSLINKTHIDYDEIKNNILVKINEENNNRKEIKIDVFFEDEEGEYLFKRIVLSNIKKYCTLYPLKIGITNIASISNKISQLKNGIIIYDADYNKKSVNYKNNFKKDVENHKNSLFFPGAKSLEKECLEILSNMKMDDKFWDECKCNNKQKFQAQRLKYTNTSKPEREQDKQWFLKERKNFGTNGKKLMEKFEEKYKKEIEEFNKELEEKLINQLKKNYGIVKEKLK